MACVQMPATYRNRPRLRQRKQGEGRRTYKSSASIEAPDYTRPGRDPNFIDSFKTMVDQWENMPHTVEDRKRHEEAVKQCMSQQPPQDKLTWELPPKPVPGPSQPPQLKPSWELPPEPVPGPGRPYNPRSQYCNELDTPEGFLDPRGLEPDDIPYRSLSSSPAQSLQPQPQQQFQPRRWDVGRNWGGSQSGYSSPGHSRGTSPAADRQHERGDGSSPIFGQVSSRGWKRSGA